MWEYVFLVPVDSHEISVAMKDLFLLSQYCFCEPQQSCLAPLRLKGSQPHSNTCIVTHNACPICQSECGELTFWHVHVCIPASPQNPAGTSQHNYWVICEELWVRIMWAKQKMVWGKGAVIRVLILIFRLQISGNYKTHLGYQWCFSIPKYR